MSTELTHAKHELPALPEPERRPARRRRRRTEVVVAVEPVLRRRRSRALVNLVLLAAAAAVAIPAALWIRYRASYVVTTNAVVRGSMTNVGAQIQGAVTSVDVEAGEIVRAGQVLAHFEQHPLRASLLRAESRLAETTSKVDAALARVSAARVQTAEARAQGRQATTLANKDLISRDEMRTAQSKVRVAEAQEATTTADWRAAQAEADAARAEVTLARSDLAATLIRAPADGKVVRRIVEPGASVVVGEPIVALWIGKALWVEAWIAEDQVSQIAVGNPANVTIKSSGTRAFQGVVETIGVSTDFELPDNTVPQPRGIRMRTTPVVGVRIRIDRSEGLFPGLSAVVGIRRNTSK